MRLPEITYKVLWWCIGVENKGCLISTLIIWTRSTYITGTVDLIGNLESTIVQTFRNKIAKLCSEIIVLPIPINLFGRKINNSLLPEK